MIVVRIEMWPSGSEELKRDLAVVVIGNDLTGTDQQGNYRVIASHQAGTKYAKTLEPRELLAGVGVWKRGRVEAFPRRLGAVQLVRRAMASLR